MLVGAHAVVVSDTARCLSHHQSVVWVGSRGGCHSYATTAAKCKRCLPVVVLGAAGAILLEFMFAAPSTPRAYCL